jgi:hypothetical protein
LRTPISTNSRFLDGPAKRSARRALPAGVFPGWLGGREFDKLAASYRKLTEFELMAVDAAGRHGEAAQSRTKVPNKSTRIQAREMIICYTGANSIMHRAS